MDFETLKKSAFSLRESAKFDQRTTQEEVVFHSFRMEPNRRAKVNAGVFNL